MERFKVYLNFINMILNILKLSTQDIYGEANMKQMRQAQPKNISEREWSNCLFYISAVLNDGVAIEIWWWSNGDWMKVWWLILLAYWSQLPNPWNKMMNNKN